MIGPVFFALLNEGMHYGFRLGASIALGVMLSDAFYAFVTYLGINQLTKNENFQHALGIGGGIILFIFGLQMIMKPVKPRPQNGNGKNDVKPHLVFKNIVKGIMLNLVNPFVIVFWVGIATMVDVKFQTNREAFFFYASMIFMVFSSDLLKVFLAKKLRSVVTPRFMTIFNRISGVALLAYGFRMLFYVFS